MLLSTLPQLPPAGGAPASYWIVTFLAAAGVCLLTVLVMKGRKK